MTNEQAASAMQSAAIEGQQRTRSIDKVTNHQPRAPRTLRQERGKKLISQRNGENCKPSLSEPGKMALL